MSYYYLYNPKLFIDVPGWRKRLEQNAVKKEIKEAEKVVEDILPETPDTPAQVFTPELKTDISKFVGISQKISSIEDLLAKNLEENAKKLELLKQQAELAELRLKLALQILEQHEDEITLLAHLLD